MNVKELIKKLQDVVLENKDASNYDVVFDGNSYDGYFYVKDVFVSIDDKDIELIGE